MREARAMNHDLRMHRAQEKMVLILLAHASGMRQPEQIEVAIRWPWSEFAPLRGSEELREQHSGAQPPLGRVAMTVTLSSPPRSSARSRSLWQIRSAES